MIAVMIESDEGVRNADTIAAVEGVDLIQIGANDLSYHLGLPEQPTHPHLLSAISTIERAALSHGKALGGAPLPGMPVGELLARGYRLITIGRDTAFVSAGVIARLAEARGIANMQ
jgi:4-hydroxy-2-oxoheptanedioate aldolase